jgi:hypothetical protein
MPVVINELVFRGEIAAAPRDGRESEDRRVHAPVDVEALVERCVEEVLRVLDRKRER